MFEVDAKDLRGADLRGAQLNSADLRGADLRGADLRGADLRGADLHDADLRDANLHDANLWQANLEGADLRDANLEGAHLRRANLEGADLRGATYGRYYPMYREPIQIGGLVWWITILDNSMIIGCEHHYLYEWFAFSDKQISAMDGRSALKFWRKYKDTLRSLAIAEGRYNP